MTAPGSLAAHGGADVKAERRLADPDGNVLSLGGASDALEARRDRSRGCGGGAAAG